MKKQYCVIIGDIIQSKEIKERRAFQRRFFSILERINKDFASEIVSKFTITIGDEFQGVLKDMSQSYNVIDKIQESFNPVKLRFGVGRGIITTQLKKEALGMDGPAFHSAREAIEVAKKRKKEIIYQTQNKERNMALNALVSAISDFKASWTKRQLQAVQFYIKFKTQVKAARAMGIDRTTLTKMLQAARWENILELEEAVNSLCGLF